jgi:hypothetical protein
MKITPELLEKYYLGKCTPEENSAIEKWQVSNDPEDDLVLSATEKTILERDIWQKLEKTTVALPAIPVEGDDVTMHRNPNSIKQFGRWQHLYY